MKHVKLLLSAAMLASFAGSVQAQESGVYYLYDAANKVFISRGCNWGTEASPDRYGIPLEWDAAAGSLRSFDWNGNVYLNDGVYTDGGSVVKWTTTASGDGYTLSANGKFMTHKAGSLGEYCTMTEVADEATVWQFMSKADHDAMLAAYPAANKQNMIAAAGMTATVDNFEEVITNNYTSAVVQTIDPTQFTWAQSVKDQRGNANNSSPREVFSGEGTFTLSLDGLKQGLYKVTIPAFYRDGGFEHCNKLAEQGYFQSNAYITANGEQVRIKAWAEDRTAPSNPNSIDEARNIFNSGKFKNEVYAYVNADGKLEVKVTVPAWQGNCWTIYGTTTLTYYSDQMSAEEADAMKAKAAELDGKAMENSAQTALTEALNAFNADGTVANFNALSAAVTAAQASVDAYAKAEEALAGRTRLINNTNFYTAEALEKYYTAVKDKFNARSLTTVEALGVSNPETVTGWKAGAETNEFLCSSFGIADYDQGLRANTWSTEGANDGTGFVVPFYEYWRDGNSTAGLDAKTFTANIGGLEPGTYQVTLEARVQPIKGQTTLTGATVRLNDGTPVTLAGKQVSGQPYYLDTYTVYGTVGEDGKLSFVLDVADGNNITWVSMRNLKYAKANVIAMDENEAYTPAAATGVVTLKRTLVADVWNTLVVPFDLTAAQVKAAFGENAEVVAFDNTDGDNLNFTTTEEIKANVPVLVKAAAASEFTFNGVTVVEGTPVAEGTNWNFTGTYAPKTTVAEGAYLLQNNKLFKSTGDASLFFVNGFRAFFTPKSSAGAKPVLNINGHATAIDKVVSGVAEDGTVYNLAGQKVSATYKGVVIKNGKKVMNK